MQIFRHTDWHFEINKCIQMCYFSSLFKKLSTVQKAATIILFRILGCTFTMPANYYLPTRSFLLLNDFSIWWNTRIWNRMEPGIVNWGNKDNCPCHSDSVLLPWAHYTIDSIFTSFQYLSPVCQSHILYHMETPYDGHARIQDREGEAGARISWKISKLSVYGRIFVRTPWKKSQGYQTSIQYWAIISPQAYSNATFLRNTVTGTLSPLQNSWWLKTTKMLSKLDPHPLTPD